MAAKLTIRSFFTELTAALLVLLFLYTAITKLKDRDGFVAAMAHNPILSGYTYLLSWLIPLLEVTVVVLLFIPGWRRYGLLTGSILMAVFTGYVAYMLLGESELPCTCGGILQRMSWPQHFWFNLFFTIIAFASFFLYPKRFVANKQEVPNTCEDSRQQLTN